MQEKTIIIRPPATVDLSNFIAPISIFDFLFTDLAVYALPVIQHLLGISSSSIHVLVHMTLTNHSARASDYHIPTRIYRVRRITSDVFQVSDLSYHPLQ
jgi:hypothetical protein